MLELQATPHKGKRPTPNHLILVVEDDLDFGATLIQIIKEETPYKAILATSGPEALNIIAHLKCDLFLLDYHLPHMNGFELFDRLHATKGYEETPAIFLSASTRLSQPGLEQRHLIRVTKPIELDELLHTIQHILQPEL